MIDVTERPISFEDGSPIHCSSVQSEEARLTFNMDPRRFMRCSLAECADHRCGLLAEIYQLGSVDTEGVARGHIKNVSFRVYIAIIIYRKAVKCTE